MVQLGLMCWDGDAFTDHEVRGHCLLRILVWEDISEAFYFGLSDRPCLCVDSFCLFWLSNKLDFGGGTSS